MLVDLVLYFRFGRQLSHLGRSELGGTVGREPGVKG